ncbi:MAG: MFS transporter [Lachnospiraceae bacterium]|nr:MFS transporter [Lachnospiraceae bacterium]
MMFCCNGIIFNVFSVFLPFIKHSFALSNTQFSVMITCRSLSSLLSISLCGSYYRHLSLRTGMFLASMICVTALFCYTFAGSYKVLLAGAVLSGLGYGLGTNVPIAMMLGRWFVYRRNFAMSLVSMATSIALVGFPSAVTWLVGKYSLGYALALVAILDLCVAVAGISLLRNHPDDLGLLPYGKSEDSSETHEREAEQTVDNTKKRQPARMLHSCGVTKEDWLLLGPAILLLGAVAWTAAGYMTVLFDSIGVRPHLIAISMTVYGMSLLVAKLIYGWLTDVLGSYLCNWFYCLMLILGCILLCMGGRFPLAVWLGSAALGIGMTVSIVGLVAWAGDLGTSEQYNTLIQRFQFLLTVGGILFTTAPGVIADHAGGSYIPAYMILAVFSLLFTVSIQLLYYRKMHNV